MTDATPEAGPPSQGRLAGGLGRWAPGLLMLGLLIFVWRGALQDLEGRLLGMRHLRWVDATVWWYTEIPRALLRGENPLLSVQQGFPVLTDHLSLHGSLGDVLLSAPLFVLFSPIMAYNLTILVFLLFNAFAAQVFFRRLGCNPWVAAGLALSLTLHSQLVGFLDEGKSTQLLTGWIFVALTGARDLLQRPTTASIRVFVIGCVGAFLSYWYYGFFTWLLAGLWLAWVYPGLPLEARLALRKKSLRAVLLTVACCLPLGLPLVQAVALGPGIKGVSLFSMPHGLSFSALPLDIFRLEPRENQWLPYLGLALLLPTLGQVARGGRRAGARGVAALDGPWPYLLGLLLFYLLILGPFLHVAGRPLVLGGRYLVPLPWLLLHLGVPFFSRLSYPYIAFPFLAISLAILVGLQLNRLEARGPRGPLLAKAFAGLLLLEVLARGDTRLNTSPFQLPAFYQQLASASEPGALIEFPFGNVDFRQIYQSFHHRPLYGTQGHEDSWTDWPGQVEVLHAQPLLYQLYSWQMYGTPLQIRLEDREKARQAGFSHLILSELSCLRSRYLSRIPYPQVQATLTQALGTPVHASRDLVAWAIDPRQVATADPAPVTEESPEVLELLMLARQRTFVSQRPPRVSRLPESLQARRVLAQSLLMVSQVPSLKAFKALPPLGTPLPWLDPRRRTPPGSRPGVGMPVPPPPRNPLP